MFQKLCFLQPPEAERKNVSSAHKLDGLGKIKEHAPRSEHVHLHQDIGHICKNHLQATLLPQISKYAHASKRNLLILRITCLDRSRWRYRGTLFGIRSFLEKGMAKGPPTQRLSKHLSPGGNRGAYFLRREIMWGLAQWKRTCCSSCTSSASHRSQVG